MLETGSKHGGGWCGWETDYIEQMSKPIEQMSEYLEKEFINKERRKERKNPEVLDWN